MQGQHEFVFQRGPARKKRRRYYGRYKLPGDARQMEVALGTTDKEVAKRRLRKIVEEKEREAAGIIAPKALRDGAQKLLLSHLEEFLADVEAKGRDEEYAYTLRRRSERLFKECGWNLPKDVSADSFVAWRAKQKKAAKTLNEYLDTAKGLLNWMQRQGRLLANPLAVVGKAETRGMEKRVRRAYTDDEMRRLLAVAGPRKAVYLLAAYSGLRRGEIEALQKGDLSLYSDNPFVKARASTTKNHEEAVIWLHPEAVAELRKLMPPGAPAGEAAFDEVPSVEQLRTDLQAAGIPLTDERGRVADFHAFRHTLATNLARAGVSPRVAMEFMRHSDLRLTNKTYTDAALLPMVEAVEKLPGFLGTCTHICTHAGDSSGHFVSSSVAVSGEGKAHGTVGNTGWSHLQALPGAPCPGSDLVPRLGLEPRTN
jgi:integrase